MKKLKILRVVLLIPFLITSLSGCEGQSKPVSVVEDEYKFRRKMDAWMEPYRYEQIKSYDEWLIGVENQLEGVREHPFHKHMQAFYHEHQDEYLKLRNEDLERYPQAPMELPGYVLSKDFSAYLAKQDKDQDFTIGDRLKLTQDIYNFRTLTVEDTRTAVTELQGFIENYFMYELEIGPEIIIRKGAYSDKFFVESIGDDSWQITFLNRSYALKYTWNIQTNHVSFLELWIYEGEQQVEGWLSDVLPKANTEMQGFVEKINAMRWGMYDHIEKDIAWKFDWQNKTDSLKQVFFQENKEAYTRIRENTITSLPKANSSRLRSFKTPYNELKGDFLYALDVSENDAKPILPIKTALYDLDGSQTIFYFYYMASAKARQYGEYIWSPTLLGNDLHAKEINKNLWEIQFIYRDYALSYRWNIENNELSEIEVRKKTINEK